VNSTLGKRGDHETSFTKKGTLPWGLKGGPVLFLIQIFGYSFAVECLVRGGKNIGEGH